MYSFKPEWNTHTTHSKFYTSSGSDSLLPKSRVKAKAGRFTMAYTLHKSLKVKKNKLAHIH